MKTIQELNEKMWYRFVKVIYIILGVCIMIGVLTITFNTGTEEERDCQEISTTNDVDIIQHYLDDKNVSIENRKTVFKMLQNNVPKNLIEGAINSVYKGNISTSQSIEIPKESSFLCKNIFSRDYPNWLHILLIILYSTICSLFAL